MPNGADIELLEQLGAIFVIPTTPGVPSPGNVMIETAPTLIDGALHQQWIEAPAQEIEPETQDKMTHLEFMTTRLRPQELVAIFSAAKQSIEIEVWLEMFKMAQEIDRNDPRLIVGLNALETAGVIAAGRPAEILAW